MARSEAAGNCVPHDGGPGLTRGLAAIDPSMAMYIIQRSFCGVEIGGKAA